VIIGQEEFERASKRPLIPHDDVIEALPPQSTNQTLDERIVPRGTGRDQDLLSTKTLSRRPKSGP
jgi:hypothetical protein